MSLREQLQDRSRRIGVEMPRLAAAYEALVASLKDRGIGATSLKQGDRMPNFMLPNLSGRTVSAHELRRGRPLVISFFHGGWCPYCTLELRARQAALPEIAGLGARQVAITPDTGAARWLFTVLTDWLHLHGHEKAMRIGTGSAELIASILLFVPRVQVVGATLSLGIISGAIFFHLVSPLGVDPYHDGAVLFKEACGVWIASLAILLIRRERAIELVERYLPFLPIPTGLRLI